MFGGGGTQLHVLLFSTIPHLPFHNIYAYITIKAYLGLQITNGRESDTYQLIIFFTKSFHD